MYDHINEPVETTVEFRSPVVRPLSMRWNNRDYQIGSVNMVHKARDGDSRIFFFTVSEKSNANIFKLQFNTETLEWRLLEIYNEN